MYSPNQLNFVSYSNAKFVQLCSWQSLASIPFENCLNTVKSCNENHVTVPCLERFQRLKSGKRCDNEMMKVSNCFTHQFVLLFICFVVVWELGPIWKAAYNMGLRRPGVTKEYEEMPGANVPISSTYIHHSHLHKHSPSNPHVQRNTQAGDLTVCQDLEMSSVSVVPDGKFSIWSYYRINCD